MQLKLAAMFGAVFGYGSLYALDSARMGVSRWQENRLIVEDSKQGVYELNLSDAICALPCEIGAQYAQFLLALVEMLWHNGLYGNGISSQCFHYFACEGRAKSLRQLGDDLLYYLIGSLSLEHRPVPL